MTTQSDLERLKELERRIKKITQKTPPIAPQPKRELEVDDDPTVKGKGYAKKTGNKNTRNK